MACTGKNEIGKREKQRRAGEPLRERNKEREEERKIASESHPKKGQDHRMRTVSSSCSTNVKYGNAIRSSWGRERQRVCVCVYVWMCTCVLPSYLADPRTSPTSPDIELDQFPSVGFDRGIRTRDRHDVIPLRIDTIGYHLSRGISFLLFS